MSLKSAVFALMLSAVAAGVGADVPDGRGGRTSPQAGALQPQVTSNPTPAMACCGPECCSQHHAH